MIVTQGLGNGMLVSQGYGGAVISLIKYITRLFMVPFRRVVFKV